MMDGARARASVLADVAESARRHTGLELDTPAVALALLAEGLGNVSTAILSLEGLREALVQLAGTAVAAAIAVQSWEPPREP